MHKNKHFDNAYDFLEGPVGQRASPFSAQSCSKQAFARAFAPPNPRLAYFLAENPRRGTVSIEAP
jgi:hypothetical protein